MLRIILIKAIENNLFFCCRFVPRISDNPGYDDSGFGHGRSEFDIFPCSDVTVRYGRILAPDLKITPLQCPLTIVITLFPSFNHLKRSKASSISSEVSNDF